MISNPTIWDTLPRVKGRWLVTPTWNTSQGPIPKLDFKIVTMLTAKRKRPIMICMYAMGSRFFR